MKRILVASMLLAGCAPPEVRDIAPPPLQSRYHAAGFAAAPAHGLPAKFAEEDCRTCHGPNLEGTAAAANVSCDSCHAQGWKQSCTFCHGGTNDATGAPPRDISNLVDEAQLTFRAHTKHVSSTSIAAPIDCAQCHVKPANALDPGHWFDDTPGRAEVTGSYANGTCSSSYCHGNGRGANGTVSQLAGAMTCASCHPAMTTPARWASMSGEHEKHLEAGDITCADCHTLTVDVAQAVVDPAKHVDGARQIAFSVTTIAWNATARRCDGPCHGQDHGDGW